ncbi:hypothetical protein BDW72DRAFT_199618 [Aspergillus terricola var. indicus]
MWIGNWFFAALTGFSAISVSHAYWIDPESCSKDHQKLIVDGITSAINMMDAGAEQLVNPSEEISRLLTNLFGPDTQRQTNNVRGVFLKTRRAIDVRNTALTKPRLSYYDVRFYCDSRRIKPQPSRVHGIRLFNTHTNELLAENYFEDLFTCFGNFAWTKCPDDELENCEITFCPYFLQYGMKRKYNTFGAWWKDKSAATWGFLATKLDRLVTNRKYTPIDLVSLFDKVILHELMHTRGAEGAPSQRFIPEDVNDREGYGWKNAKRLAPVVTDLTTDPLTLGPEKNADNLALFGSAALMIKEGVKIHDNGSFVRPKGMNERRFDVWFDDLLDEQ